MTTVKAASVNKLRAIGRRLSQYAVQLNSMAKSDPELANLLKSIEMVRSEAYALAEVRALRAAERSDKGRVLWTVFVPLSYPEHAMKTITRTPYRVITRTQWPAGFMRPASDDVSCKMPYSCGPGSYDKDDFNFAMAGCDYTKSRERQAQEEAA